VELLVLDNRYRPAVALKNAERFVRERVDLVIEFQTDQSVAPAIATRYLEAGIPLVAIDIPHPGATYFGANNYLAGRLAGRHLGEWARARWNGAVGEILLIELARAGSLVQARMSGVLAGLREVLPEATRDCPVMSLDGDGQLATSYEKVRRHLRGSVARHVLVGAANDPSALGAVHALREAGRSADCAVVGQNAEPDARAELRRRGTPLVASVGYFPERYGDGLMKLALDILAGRATPPAHFIRHQLVTTANVDHLYPNDALLRRPAPAPVS
jgi:ribose transport system substrate-binding protein